MNRYFYIDGEGKQKGTFSPEELRKEHIKHDTLVWTQGLNEWKKAEEVSELQYLFQMETPNPQPKETYSQEQTFQQQAYTAKPPVPRNWLVESILVTILPFVLCGSILSLLGIIAIVYASQVESNYNRGDFANAETASNSAGRWTKITFWISVAWLILIVLAVVLTLVFAGSFIGLSDIFDNSFNTAMLKL
ncbi:MAG: CD225/dispanin family protein [Dysgonamonadaceae bacterium]|jgi:uncharacterized membrane protein|nr:CD225/dispanin family protein [Dysgonamonadaceae bacterium]MDD3308925.1 CD225/dispanin family protein [Dysgonamonadaceae bacterium]MDD3900220.1 CD225/dispanin family protein [Dysgonamonadaceae bacterium]MDD4398492.1 CD225/dispanin family protein [Dysgonamonadaceae bacterium]MEA5081210.1 CD225/dispanin family protein [Dysgonamonadaceae bacterium]